MINIAEIKKLRKKHGVKTVNDDIEKLFDSGLTLEEIGIKNNLSRERVRQIIAKSGRKPRQQQTQERIDEILKTVADQAIAQNTHISTILTKNGLNYSYYVTRISKKDKTRVKDALKEKRLNEIEQKIVERLKKTNVMLSSTLLQKKRPHIGYSFVMGEWYSIDYWKERIWEKYPKLRNLVPK